nr:hypothetical protein 19 [bacterium]
MKKLIMILCITFLFITLLSLSNIAFATPWFIRDDLNFTPDRVITFDSLTVGTILQTGDPIAPGVTFGGALRAGPLAGNYFLEKALVVDTGGGNLALERMLVDYSPYGPWTGPSVFAFTISQGVESIAARFTIQHDDSRGNPGMYGIDADSNVVMAWGYSPTNPTYWMGISGADVTPMKYIFYGISAFDSQQIDRLDDLSILYANPIPEPATMLLLGSGLAGLAGFRRKLKKS